MITGRVNTKLVPIIDLSLIGDDEELSTVEATVDTGFDGYVMLPEDVVQEIGFLPLGEMPAELAEGSRTQLRAFAGTVLWGEVEVPVVALAGGTQPLIGVRLLSDHQLTINVTPYGKVEIAPLS